MLVEGNNLLTLAVATDFPKCDLLIVMGTSLQVQPFASLIHHVPRECPRFLLNREVVGTDPSGLGYGFQFDALDITTGQSGVTNISNASIKGIELQAQAKLGGFGFDGGLAYVDSNLDKVTLVDVRNLPPAPVRLPQCVPSSPPGTCFDYTSYIGVGGGGPNLFSPKWSYNFGVQYEAWLAEDVSLTPRLNYAYVGSRWTNLFYNPQLDYLRGRGLLSAQITLRYEEWEIEAYGTNLANKQYVSGQSGNSEFYGAPREFGVRASVRF